MNNLLDRLKFVRHGFAVRRYHQQFTAVTETVAAHSAGVGMFLILMNDNLPSSELLAAALVHDLPEGVTGDIPSPAKRAMGAIAKSELDKLEGDLLDKNGFYYFLTDDEYRQLKLADCLDGLAFCTEEMRRGNSGIRKCGDNYSAYIGQLEKKTDREYSVSIVVQQKWEKVNGR